MLTVCYFPDASLPLFPRLSCVIAYNRVQLEMGLKTTDQEHLILLGRERNNVMLQVRARLLNAIEL